MGRLGVRINQLGRVQSFSYLLIISPDRQTILLGASGFDVASRTASEKAAASPKPASSLAGFGFSRELSANS
jgi:hypothetical protein